VTRPFAGLKVACYYGCLLTRPPEVTLADDPEYPTHMDEVAEALGCEPLDWNYKTDCCGASLALTEQGIVDDLVGRILTDAKACGAEAVIVACPLCQVNLDGRQVEIARKDAGWQGIPVVFLSQLVGRALGLDDKALGLKALDITAVMAAHRTPRPIESRARAQDASPQHVMKRARIAAPSLVPRLAA
jgi:heterodisulfide reductase subunit B